MSFKVRIEQFDREIVVEPGQTILECALFEGIDYPFACQQGQCGSCKSQLIAGNVFMHPGYNPMALPEAERARGMILACQAQPQADCVVSVVAIDGRIVHPERRLRCTVTGSFAAGRAARIVTLRIDTGGPFNFEAGQCVVLTMPDMSEQALGVASRPIDPFIELHLDPTAGNCPVRATVAVRGPYGDAYLHDEHVGPMLAIARGTGLAPIVSIVASALAIGMRQRIHLYIAAAPGADHYYLDRLGELAARHANLIVKTVPTVTANEADGATDLVEAVGRDFASLAAYRVYVAAPVGERTRLQELAIERGMLPEHWAACSPEPSTG